MRWAAVLAGAGLLAGACSHGSSSADLKPHPLPGSVTSVVDYTGVALGHVPGTTTTAVPETGTASIVGSVSGPGGLVPGATVRIEHLVDGATPVRTDVTTGPDGRFALPNIPGGRYRVRAFLAPALALVTPDVRFLPDAKEASFDLRMEDQRKVVARAAVAPQAPYVGDDVNLAVVVANRTVDSDGIVRSVPLPGLQVELGGLGAYRLKPPDQDGGVFFPRTTTTQAFEGTTVAFTDSAGTVRYALRCAAAGSPGLELLVDVTVTPAQQPGQPPPVPTQQVQHLPLTVPACIDPSTISTEPIDPTATSAPGGTRTTGRTSTTSGTDQG